MAETGLKPCPLCASEQVESAHRPKGPAAGHYVRCRQCLCSSGECATASGAAAYWNTRPTPPLPEDIGWRGISTAPEGKSILVVCESTAVNSTYGEGGHRSVHQAVFEDGAWIGGDLSKLENECWRVTFWQPLPKPALPIHRSDCAIYNEAPEPCDCHLVDPSVAPPTAIALIPHSPAAEAFIREQRALPDIEGLVEQRAPVQGFSAGIPWSLHLRAYDAYCAEYAPQPAMIDLEGRNCRGGFTVRELDHFIPGWRDEVSEIARLKDAIESLASSNEARIEQAFKEAYELGYLEGYSIEPRAVSLGNEEDREFALLNMEGRSEAWSDYRTDSASAALAKPI